ncbi:MAG: Ig-like domain-containing protein, partial [Myxococcales bacterium]
MRRLVALLVAATVAACTEDPPPPPSDTTAPTLTSLSPADGADGIALNTVITATFDEAIDPASLTIALADAKGAAVAGTLAVAEDKLSGTLTPAAALLEKGAYTITVSGFKDAAGNAGEAATAKFTTAGIAPTVVATSPEKDAVQVALDAKIFIDFSEPVNAASAEAAVKLLHDGSAVAATFSVDAARVELRPAAALEENAQYTLEIGTALTDLAGVPLAAPFSASFTTRGDAPNVVSTSPVDGAQNVSPDATVKFVFSKELALPTITTDNVTLTEGGDPVD